MDKKYPMKIVEHILYNHYKYIRFIDTVILSFYVILSSIQAIICVTVSDTILAATRAANLQYTTYADLYNVKGLGS